MAAEGRETALLLFPDRTAAEGDVGKMQGWLVLQLRASLLERLGVFYGELQQQRQAEVEVINRTVAEVRSEDTHEPKPTQAALAVKTVAVIRPASHVKCIAGPPRGLPKPVQTPVNFPTCATLGL